MKHTAMAAVALAVMPVLVALWLSPPRQVSGQPWPRDKMSVVGPEAKLMGDEFNVDINISQVGCPYQGYQAYLSWDYTTLAYVDPPGVTYTGLGGMTLNAPPMAQPDAVYLGSSRSSGTSTQTGTAARVRLKCIGAGTSPLHLITLAEDPDYGTAMLGCELPDMWLVDDSVDCMSDTDVDRDGDGCSWYQEGFGAPAPYPGSTCTGLEPCYSDSVPHDFYDVPVPANADPIPNGDRDGAVNMADVMAVLSYVGAKQGRGPVHGVDYDADKNGDTVKDGVDYDRTSGPVPNPPWEAGPPNGAVTMNDIMVILPQVGLSCNAPP